MMSLTEKLKANVHTIITVPLILYALGAWQGKIVVYLWILIALSYGGLLVFPKLIRNVPGLFKVLTRMTWGGVVLMIYILIAAFIQSLVTGQAAS